MSHILLKNTGPSYAKLFTIIYFGFAFYFSVDFITLQLLLNTLLCNFFTITFYDYFMLLQVLRFCDIHDYFRVSQTVTNFCICYVLQSLRVACIYAISIVVCEVVRFYSFLTTIFMSTLLIVYLCAKWRIHELQARGKFKRTNEL